MRDFYYSQDWGTFLDVPNILLSYGAARYPNGKIRKFDLTHADKIFLDCGAYTLRNTFETYPIDHYIEWIRSIKGNVDHVATVDVIGNYPKTVKYAIKCIRSDPDLPWVPVLQGRTITEYAECADLYDRAGIDLTDRLVAIGGLKGRQQIYIRRILHSLKRFRIHAFGLTLANMKDPTIWNCSDSADSGTWKKRPNTTAEKYANLEKFKILLDRVRISHRSQTTINEFDTNVVLIVLTDQFDSKEKRAHIQSICKRYGKRAIFEIEDRYNMKMIRGPNKLLEEHRKKFKGWKKSK